MLFKGTLLTQASGAAVGLVYSRNRGGAYVRGRAIPVNPQTSLQTSVRAFMGQLSNLWANVLTQAQRDAWDVYALNVTRPNRVGDQINIGGLGQYVRSNVPRLQAGLARVDAAPAAFNVGDFTQPTLGTIDAGGDDFEVNFNNTDDWAGEVGSAMLVLASRPVSAALKYFKGPYNFAGKIAGALVVPTSPATIPLPFPVSAGQQVFFQFRVTRVDGRLSEVFRIGGLAT